MERNEYVLDSAGGPHMFTHQRCGQSFIFLGDDTLEQIEELLGSHECATDEKLEWRKQFRITNATVEHQTCGAVKAISVHTPRPVALALADQHKCGQETWDGTPAQPDPDEMPSMVIGQAKVHPHNRAGR